MKRWQLWMMRYWVCNDPTVDLNYGGSAFNIYTPLFGFIIRRWDYAENCYAFVSSLEIAWDFTFKTPAQGAPYYQHQITVWKFFRDYHSILMQHYKNQGMA